MKAISASDILRKNAPRETVGRSFAHANRYEHIREPSPANSVRSRIGSVSSQKRKEDELDDILESSMPPKKGKISEEDAVSIACMESNISKVSALCNKITMDIQEADLISDPAKSILSDIVDALKSITAVQGELTSRLSRPVANDDVVYVSKTNEGKKMSYSSVIQNEKSLKVPLPSHTRRLPTGGLVPINLGNKGKTTTKTTPPTPVETPEEEKNVSLLRLSRMRRGPPSASTSTWVTSHCKTKVPSRSEPPLLSPPWPPGRRTRTAPTPAATPL
jgi:hypothetical protein